MRSMLTGSAERRKDPRKRNTKIALVLWLAALGKAIAPRASECQNLHDGTTHPLTFTTIDVPGASSTVAIGINSRGDIVGQYSMGGTTRGFLRDKGGSFTSIDFPGGSSTTAQGINPQGHIVGTYLLGGVTHGFLAQR